jgi:hypothetical protein
MSNIFSYVTGSSTLPFSSSIAVPAVGCEVSAQSVTEGFRGLADRTKWASGSIATLSASLSGTNAYAHSLHNQHEFLSQEYRWTGHHTFWAPNIASGSELGYASNDWTTTRISRTVPIPLSEFNLFGEFETYTPSSGIIQNAGPNVGLEDYAVARIHPPSGSRVTRVRVLVQQTGGTVSPSGEAASLAVVHVVPNKTAPYGASTLSSLGSAQAGATSAFHLLSFTVGGGGKEIGDQDEVKLVVQGALNTVATLIHWADYDIDDPGPRNF